MCPVLGLGQYVKGCLYGACWHAGEFPHTLGRFGEQSSPRGQVQPSSAAAGHGILVLPCAWAHPATQISVRSLV